MKGHKEHHGHHEHDIHAHVKGHSMKHHRKHRKTGGAAYHDEHGHEVHDESPSDIYAGANSKVVKEAREKHRRGGAAHKHLEAHGHHAKHRLDRPARKSGGRANSDMHPFSSAHEVKSPAGRDLQSGES